MDILVKYATISLSILLLHPMAGFSQDSAPDLSGIWRRNPQKSPPAAHPPDEMWVKIAQNGPDITITFQTRNQGAGETNAQRLRIGAGENHNTIHGAPMTSKAAWDGTVLVVNSIAKFGEQELRMNDRWSLSPDKGTLTFTERHQFGAEPQPTQDAYVFDRQPDGSWPEPRPSKLAEQVYKNIDILKGIPSERVPVIMAAFSRSLGVACTHCHVEGSLEKKEKPTFAKARRMFHMRNWIAQNAKIEVACWTCHRGHAVPQPGPPSDSGIWPADLDLTAEQGAQPASKVYKNLKFFNSTAADLKSAMLFISASLGVGCAHCHVEGTWEKDDQPAKNSARRMLAMVRDTRREFTDIRIGCPTCHHGGSQPELEPPAR